MNDRADPKVVTQVREADLKFRMRTIIAMPWSGYSGYEGAKRAFAELCPDASPQERDWTMKQIVDKCLI